MAADYFRPILKKNRNLKNFLRSIKLWAYNRGIYGGITGFLGGIIVNLLEEFPYKYLLLKFNSYILSTQSVNCWIDFSLFIVNGDGLN